MALTRASAAVVKTEELVNNRNRIINGDMRIDQRNAGAAVTTSDSFPVDRFKVSMDFGGAFSSQRSTDAPSGFINSTQFTTTTANPSLSASQYAAIIQNIEGFNVADLGWGTANAKTITLSFWVRSSLTGTFGGTLKNSAVNRSYPFTYTISAADTWEYKTVTVTGDTSGTWLTDNGIGIRLAFGLGVGSTFSGTAGSWSGSNFISATGAVSVVGTLNATWYITGVQLEVGSVATPFERRPYGMELALCQRYYQNHGAMFQCGQAYGTGVDGFTTNYSFPVSMRIAPTSTVSNGSDGQSLATLVVSTITTHKCTFEVRNTTGGGTSKWYKWDQVFSAEL